MLSIRGQSAGTLLLTQNQSQTDWYAAYESTASSTVPTSYKKPLWVPRQSVPPQQLRQKPSRAHLDTLVAAMHLPHG